MASVVTADGRAPTDGPVGIPNFLFPESCAAVLARGAERRAWLSRPLGRQPSYDDLDPAAARALVAARLDGDGAGWLGTAEGAALLATHGIATVESHHCADVECAVGVAQEIAGPIALKTDFPPPARAGAVDAVILGLGGEVAVRGAWRELERRMQTAGRAWTAQSSSRSRLRARTCSWAPFGSRLRPRHGDRLERPPAGLAHTVAFRVLPVTVAEADELIDASESVATLLDGFRGSPQVDREALRELILRFAGLLREVPEVAEADLTPCGACRGGTSSSTCECASSAAGRPSASRPGDRRLGGHASSACSVATLFLISAITPVADCPGRRAGQRGCAVVVQQDASPLRGLRASERA